MATIPVDRLYSFNTNLHAATPTQAFFNEQCYVAGFHEYSYASWLIQAHDLSLKALPRPVHRSIRRRSTDVCFEDGGSLCYLEIDHTHISLTVASLSDADAGLIIEKLKKLFQEVRADDEVVPVSFWAYNGQNARQWSRQIATVNWHETRRNYAAETAPLLDKMMNFTPEHGGIFLWHGLPGVGKTFSLRALMRAWVGWCEFHCVTDPERFFGDSNYMLDVLLTNNGAGDYGDEDLPHDGKSDKWQLYILEDAGELLTVDAKEVVGQGLSRLLNIADGLIGQGLKAIIFITTNEPLKKFHPAVIRPGRCLAEVEFTTLDHEQAERWLEKPLPRKNGGYTIAELYAIRSGADLSELRSEEGIGF